MWEDCEGGDVVFCKGEAEEMVKVVTNERGLNFIQ